jgi:hypothetical protein
MLAILLIGLTHDNKLVVVVVQAEQHGTAIALAFEIGEIENKFIFDISLNDSKLNFAGKYILNSLGFEID